MTTTEPLTGRALDIAVHKALGLTWTHEVAWHDIGSGFFCMYCKRLKQPNDNSLCYDALPHYSTDENLRRVILAAVAERGQRTPFIVELMRLTKCVANIDREFTAWTILNATQADLCRAFLAVAGGKA